MSAYSFFGNSHIESSFQGRLGKAGFTKADDVSSAQIILTYCTISSELEDLYFGENGLLTQAQKDALLIDLSPASPHFAQEIYSVATLSGYKMVSAPLSVVNKLAENALAENNLTCTCFGASNAIQEAKPVLSALYGTWEEGASSAVAQMVRSVKTMQDCAQILSGVEAQAYFQAFSSSVSIVEVGDVALDAQSTEINAVIEALQDQRFTSSYTVEMMLAELSSILVAAEEFEVLLPQVETAFHLYELLAVIGGADKGVASVALVYRPDNQDQEFGLDWSRADSLYASPSHVHDEDENSDYQEEDDFLDEMFGSSDDYHMN